MKKVFYSSIMERGMSDVTKWRTNYGEEKRGEEKKKGCRIKLV